MRVMTWNVENLFRPGGMAGVTDPALYEQKLEKLASMIAAHRPDVIGLQEVGDPARSATQKQSSEPAIRTCWLRRISTRCTRSALQRSCSAGSDRASATS